MRAGLLITLSVALSAGLASAALAGGGYNPVGYGSMLGGGSASFESDVPVSTGVAPIPPAKPGYRAEGGGGGSMFGGGSPSYEAPYDATVAHMIPEPPRTRGYMPDGSGSGSGVAGLRR